MAKIEIKSTLNSDQYKRGIAEMQSKTKAFGGGLSNVKKWMAGAFTVAAIMGVIAAIKQAGQALIEYGGHISDIADQSGMTTDQVQGLEDAFTKAGVEIDMLPKVMSKVHDAMAKHKEGAQGAIDAFNALGISQEQIDKSSPAEMLELVAAKMGQAERGSVAYASAMEILGSKAGTKLQSVLEDLGQNGLQGMIDQTQEAGQMMDAEMIAKLDAAGDKIDLFKKRIMVWGATSLDKIMKVGAGFKSLFSGGSFAGGMKKYTETGELDAMNRKAKEANRAKDAKVANEAESSRLRAARAAAEQAKKDKKLKDIEESVKLEIEPSDRFRKMGGAAGSMNSMALAMERRKLEIAQKQEDYLKEIAENTKDSGGLEE